MYYKHIFMVNSKTRLAIVNVTVRLAVSFSVAIVTIPILWVLHMPDITCKLWLVYVYVD